MIDTLEPTIEDILWELLNETTDELIEVKDALENASLKGIIIGSAMTLAVGGGIYLFKKIKNKKEKENKKEKP